MNFFLATLIVGFVTSGLKIKFDRFFAIIFLTTVLGQTIFMSVNIFLWVILFGALYILLGNLKKILAMPKKDLTKMLIMIPVLTAAASFGGSYLFSISSAKVLTTTLAILAVSYGLRLIFIHFKKHELNHTNPSKGIQVICSIFGPIISGISLGFIGSSLKPLKLSFAVKLGKMNMQKVYLGNTITAFFASLFAIIWHNTLFTVGNDSTFMTTMFYGATFWTLTHYISEITDVFFKDSWRKVFQVIIGIVLLFVSIRLFNLN